MTNVNNPDPSFMVSSNETRYPTALLDGSVTAADSIYKGSRIVAVMGYFVEVVGTVKATVTISDHAGGGNDMIFDLVTPAAANPGTNCYVPFGQTGMKLETVWTGIRATVENAGAWRIRIFFKAA